MLGIDNGSLCPTAFHLDVSQLPPWAPMLEGLVCVFSCCLEVSTTSVYYPRLQKHMELPGNTPLSSMTGENPCGVHNSNSFDNPRVTNLQVKRALWGRAHQGHMAMSGRPQKHVQLEPSCLPCAGTARMARSAGGQGRGTALSDPCNHISCSASNS